eukprot:SAG11_NODE_1396_length_5036_cov_2.382824_4_plen_137_part_00
MTLLFSWFYSALYCAQEKQESRYFRPDTGPRSTAEADEHWARVREQQAVKEQLRLERKRLAEEKEMEECHKQHSMTRGSTTLLQKVDGARKFLTSSTLELCLMITQSVHLLDADAQAQSHPIEHVLGRYYCTEPRV